ncbi:hypothetical protein AGMMS50212_01660 [Spirochaetia bacterium]|nr:hypothetical protein AGMMS50212_01660 [Spirochaetia bacterium]
MIIREEKHRNVMTYYLEGRMDTNAAAVLEEKISVIPRFITELIIDFEKLNYISSMGLRVVLKLYKKMAAIDGKLTCKNFNGEVRSAFEISGFINTVIRDESAAIIRKAISSDTISYSLIGNLDELKAQELKGECKKIREEGIKDISMDCSQVTAISNEAGAALIEIRKQVESKGGALFVNNLNEQLAKKHSYLEYKNKLTSAYEDAEKLAVLRSVHNSRDEIRKNT